MRSIFGLFLTAVLCHQVWLSASATLPNATCYSCTDYDVDQYTLEVRDASWTQWLRTIPTLIRSPTCADPFNPDETLKTHTRNCPGGVCMKILVHKEGEADHVLRSCLTGARGKLEDKCVQENNSKGHLFICTCSGGLCNGSGRPVVPLTLTSLAGLILLVPLLFRQLRQF